MMKKDEIRIRDPFIFADIITEKYYMFGTTDITCWNGKAIGFDAYTSKDLINWEGPFAVFRPGSDFWADRNFWAPEVHEYNGKYYMFASFKAENKCRGTQILISDKLLGPYIPYSKGPVTPETWECLDGTLYVDEEKEPWIIFCHEWLQTEDGEICAMRLSKELDRACGRPHLLFHASEAPWSKGFMHMSNNKEKPCYITDGPFLFKTGKNDLIMLWSSLGEEGYAIGVAKSSTGKITGPWIQQRQSLFKKDGGHGMIFRTFDKQLMLTIHAPNKTPNERPAFYRIAECDEGIDAAMYGKFHCFGNI